MKSKKENMVDEHLLHILKNTTPFERMVWLKKNIDFFKKMQQKKFAPEKLTSNRN